mmetsp:Transcript_1570/g.2732  ORF Transcript_1570/g.2732 Transcript_1570/m.2732 type:complete len:246 (+) Transcript_1570:1002-1739(+)
MCLRTAHSSFKELNIVVVFCNNFCQHWFEDGMYYIGNIAATHKGSLEGSSWNWRCARIWIAVHGAARGRWRLRRRRHGPRNLPCKTWGRHCSSNNDPGGRRRHALPDGRRRHWHGNSHLYHSLRRDKRPWWRRHHHATWRSHHYPLRRNISWRFSLSLGGNVACYRSISRRSFDLTGQVRHWHLRRRCQIFFLFLHRLNSSENRIPDRRRVLCYRANIDRILRGLRKGFRDRHRWLELPQLLRGG